jgi:predicted nucleotidyltransferase
MSVASDRFGLDSKTIETLQHVFQKYTGIQKVLIYGSRAMGKHKPGSDIDLTLIAPDYGTDELLKIETEIDDLLLPYIVDLSLFHQIENKNFIEHIKRVGIEF